MRTMSLYAVAVLILFSSVLFGQSSTISVQGVLRDQNGKAVADGTYPMTFNLYTALSGGSSIWTETQNSVIVQNGVFNAKLGSVTPFGAGVTFNVQYWVGITFGSSEMSPRIELTASPYSLGLKGTSNVFSAGGSVGIGTLNPSTKLEVAGDIKVSGPATFNGTAVFSSTIQTGGPAYIGQTSGQYQSGFQIEGSTSDSINSRIRYDAKNFSLYTPYSGGTVLNADRSGNVTLNKTVGIGGAPAAGATLDVKGPIYMQGALPFMARYYSAGRTRVWDVNTGFSSSQWVGLIVGHQDNGVNLNYSGDKNDQLYCFANGATNTIWIHGENVGDYNAGSWAAYVLFINKALVDGQF